MSNFPADPEAGQRWLAWAQVDVFADAPYEGNMLAVFPNATGLSDDALQRIARETNLSETAFVFPRDEAEEQQKGIRVRIFTTQEELPFAGHPTLGTASWLRLSLPRLAGVDQITLELNIGQVLVRFPQNEPATPAFGIVAEMLQPDPHFQGGLGSDVIDALHLDRSQLHPHLEPQIVSTGLPVLIVPLRSHAALTALQPNLSREKALRSLTPAKFAYYIAREEAQTWHARLPLYGGEDPATGSAAGCAISYLVAQGAVPPDQLLTIRQGTFVHRPSRILASATLRNGEVRDVRVRGCTIPVAAGHFLHP